MVVALECIGTVGLLIFILFGLAWFFMPPRRSQSATVALVGLIIWAIASVVLTLMSLL